MPKRPPVKPIQQQWEETVNKDCIVKPPTLKSFIAVWILLVLFIISFTVCLLGEKL